MAANKVTVTTPGPAGPAGVKYEGTWTTSTGYQYRDVVLFTNGGLYFCDVAHTSGTITPTNPTVGGVTYWTVFVPAGDSFEWANRAKHSSYTDSLGNSGYSALHYSGKANDWATLTTDAVTNDANSADVGYSAKAWAIGGTEVTSTASRGAAKEWATTTGGKVDGGSGDYSAKEYAVGTTATSSKTYATKVDGAVTGTDFSSKAWAIGGTNVTSTASRGAAKEWATTTGGAVDTSEYSAKEYATGTTVATGSSKEWATTTGGAVASGEYSAKEYALGTTATSAKSYATKVDGAVTGSEYSAKAHAVGGTGVDTTDGSAKDWATKTSGNVGNTSTRGSKYYAEQAASSASNAEAAALSLAIALG